MKNTLKESLLEAATSDYKVTGAIDISIDEFVKTVLPKTSSMELFVKNSHQNKFVSVTAPAQENSGKLFKWNNDFGWSYDGNITDSIKERVKKAGGNVNADFRVSLSWFNYDDLDIHAEDPYNRHIYFGNKVGVLDVDMNAGGGRTREPVENLAWNNPPNGKYKIWVNQYSQRETNDVGFLLLYRFFHENSLIKRQPKYIWTATDQSSLGAKLREARDRYSPHAPTRYSKEEYGSDREDLFSVSVLGSASTRNPVYTQSAYYIGYESARAGMHVRSGGGRYGIMGAVSQGVMDYQNERPEFADRSHLSAIQMPRTVQFEGLALDLNDLHQGGNRYVAIEPGMDPRMQNLFRSALKKRRFYYLMVRTLFFIQS